MATAVSDTRLWIIWRKKTSTLAGDHSERGVRRFRLAAGLVDSKICAVDEEWTGLAFVCWKRKSAPALARCLPAPRMHLKVRFLLQGLDRNKWLSVG